MMHYDDPVPLNFVCGDATGLAIPAHAESLRTAGEAFLSEAFRRFGSLSPDNHIVRIAHFEPFHGGNSGHKLLLSVEYVHAEQGLHTELFVPVDLPAAKRNSFPRALPGPKLPPDRTPLGRINHPSECRSAKFSY